VIRGSGGKLRRSDSSEASKPRGLVRPTEPRRILDRTRVNPNADPHCRDKAHLDGNTLFADLINELVDEVTRLRIQGALDLASKP
jgi:hypothetical protein